MPRTSVARQASALSLQGRWYPADLLPQLQSALATLADIDVRYHSDHEQLQARAGPEAIKARFAAQLAEHYQREREPYARNLTALQHLMGRLALRC